MRPIAGDAFVHGADKGFQRPCSDTGFRVRSNIRSIDDPERCVYSIPAGEGLSPGTGVARGAMSSRGKSFPASNGLGREACRGGPLYRRNHPPPGQEQEASQPQNSHCENSDRNASNHCTPLLHTSATPRALPSIEPKMLSAVGYLDAWWRWCNQTATGAEGRNRAYVPEGKRS